MPGSWELKRRDAGGKSVTLNEGKSGVTCTSANDVSAPTLTLFKIMVNDDAGNAVVQQTRPAR